MTDGSAYEASVVSVRRGLIGKPGQLMGAIQDSQPFGTLYKNTEQGVFGTNRIGWQGEALPTGQAKAGKAIIRSTVSGNTVQEYSVEILKVYPKAGVSGRNILLRITDPALLEITGGIVQGMSGSPIIQDGKLVGAVTHVLIRHGYAVPPGGELPQRGKRSHPGVSPRGKALACDDNKVLHFAFCILHLKKESHSSPFYYSVTMTLMPSGMAVTVALGFCR
jgi:hypothetical protein